MSDTIGIRRLKKELKNMNDDPPENCIIQSINDDIYHYQASCPAAMPVNHYHNNRPPNCVEPQRLPNPNV